MTPAKKPVRKLLGRLEDQLTLPDRRRSLERERRDYERRRQREEQFKTRDQ